MTILNDMRRIFSTIAAALCVTGLTLLAAVPAQASTIDIHYSVSESDPVTSSWPTFDTDCSAAGNWTDTPRHFVQQTASVSLTGQYSFHDLHEWSDGYIAIFDGPFDEANVSNCVLTIEDSGTVLLEAGKTYVLLLAGVHGAVGDFGYVVDGPGIFSTPANFEHTIDLFASENPITADQAVTFTAIVDGPATEGSVEFFSDGVSLGTTPTTHGVATMHASGFATGDHNITAVFTGADPVDVATTLTPLVLRVNAAAVTPGTPEAPASPTAPQRVETALAG